MSHASPTPAPADRFADYDVGLEMSVPIGWTAAAAADFPLVLLAPDDHGFRANIGIRTGALDPPTPEAFQDLTRRTKAARQAELTGFTVVAERVGPQAGYPGWQLRATWDDGGQKVTQITQLFVVEPARLVEVTATCLEESERSYLPLFRQVLESWAALDDEDPGSAGD